MNAHQTVSQLHRLIESRYQAGVRQSTVIFDDDAILYQDNAHQEHIDLKETPIDDHFEIFHHVTNYLVHHGHEVTVITPNADAPPSSTKLHHLEPDDSHTSDRTPDGRYVVYLRPIAIYERTFIKAADGATVDVQWPVTTKYYKAPNDQPGTTVSEQMLQTVAYSLERHTAEPRTGDAEMIKNTGFRLLVRHMNDINDQPDDQVAWAPKRYQPFLLKHADQPIPTTKQTGCTPDAKTGNNSPRIILPEHAAIAKFHHSQHQHLVAAWQHAKPDDITIFYPDEDVEIPEIPQITASKVSVILEPGTEPFEVPLVEGQHTYPSPALKHRYDRAHSINVTYIVTQADGTKNQHTVSAPMFSSFSQDYHQLYVSPLDDLPFSDYQLRHLIQQHQAKAVMDLPFHLADYHAKCLLGHDTRQAAQQLAHHLASILDTNELHHAEGSEVEITAPDGSYSITLRPNAEAALRAAEATILRRAMQHIQYTAKSEVTSIKRISGNLGQEGEFLATFQHSDGSESTAVRTLQQHVLQH